MAIFHDKVVDDYDGSISMVDFIKSRKEHVQSSRSKNSQLFSKLKDTVVKRKQLREKLPIKTRSMKELLDQEFNTILVLGNVDPANMNIEDVV